MEQTHGPDGPSNTGYRGGCRCLGCRQAHSAAAREWRRARAAGALPAPDTPAGGVPFGVGPVEASVAAQLAGLASTVPWAPVWRELAVLDARAIDYGIRTGQYNIVGTMQSRLRDVMDRLQQGRPAGRAPDWDAWAREL